MELKEIKISYEFCNGDTFDTFALALIEQAKILNSKVKSSWVSGPYADPIEIVANPDSTLKDLHEQKK